MTLSEDVIRFLRQHIHSVLQLEILLLLRSRRVDWTADKIADELRITEQSAGVRLEDLELRDLVRAGQLAESFRYQPPTHELARSVDALAQAHDEMKYSVINLIFSEPNPA